MIFELFLCNFFRNQLIPDNRYYIVRYTQGKSGQIHKPRHQYRNSTDLNVMLDDLKPNTEYEFDVKIVRGRRQSPWSLVVVNKTRESAPSSPPRDLSIHPSAASASMNDLNSASIVLTWRPPKTPNGKVNGYVIQVQTLAVVPLWGHSQTTSRIFEWFMTPLALTYPPTLFV